MATKTRQYSDFLIGGGQSDLDLPGKPHIQPGVLHPAVAGKDVNGVAISTSHGSTYTYGTTHADGRMYYYTDIKGSKPIKDPRIGAYFGSQRHKFKSLQLLEQETATHGKNVYSIDGREWIRAVSGDSDWTITNDSWGQRTDNGSNCGGAIVEIVGYFNDINFIHSSHTDRCDDVDVYVNGTISVDGSTTLAGDATTYSPLGGRFVDPGSVINGGSTLSASLGTTPKINTLKFEAKTGGSEWLRMFGIELIAQDTTSTANKSKIQIPAQNVVSYGKKFTVSGTPHYDPFAFKTDGSTAWASGAHNGTAWPVGTGSSANIDTTTSLGLAAWVSTNYYKPYNGGRVVWWVDSSGTLKCSVNMMPPNARSIASSASLTNGTEKGDDSAGTSSAAVANNTFYPTFTDLAIDHSQAEVAKTFHFREFGNGNANGGTSGTYKDFSMSSVTGNSVAYVMDDGLTSMSTDGFEWNSSENFKLSATDKFLYITFIGTGLTLNVNQGGTLRTVAQNLPYGTHVFKLARYSNNAGTITLDGVVIQSQSTNWDRGLIWDNITFHQPKMPPIPEDAVIIADYILMADFVPNSSFGVEKMSKGVRFVSSSRDHFWDSGSALTFSIYPEATLGGFRIYNNASVKQNTLPFFGSGISQRFHVHTDRSDNTSFQIDGAAYGTSHPEYVAGDRIGSSSATHWDTSNNDGTFSQQDNSNGVNAEESVGVRNLDVGNHIMKMYDTSTGSYYIPVGSEVHSPIHTSSHYQTFETPFLHELVGGDRNMEQTNLVVTPDGKTWDEVTRDVSYMGNITWSAGLSSNVDVGSGGAIFDEYRGAGMSTNQDFHQKDFAIAYDRHICLRTGYYCVNVHSLSYTAQGANRALSVMINGVEAFSGYLVDGDHYSATLAFEIDMKRGDYFQIRGYLREGHYGNYQVTRVK